MELEWVMATDVKLKWLWGLITKQRTVIIIQRCYSKQIQKFEILFLSKNVQESIIFLAFIIIPKIIWDPLVKLLQFEGY